MITISVIFCQLALSCVHCAPKVDSNYSEEIDRWLLDEAWVDFAETERPTEQYAGPLELIRYDDMFCLDRLRLQTGAMKPYNVLCFEVTEFYAVLGNIIYVITQYPHRFVRMKTKNHEIKCFKKFFEPETIDQVYFQIVFPHTYSLLHIQMRKL